MRKKGLTLLEILVSTLILALVMTGMVNLFISGKKWILHARSRMTGGELGKTFLDPLQSYVKQSDWNSSTNDYVNENPLHKRNNEAGTLVTLDRQYTPFYTVTVPAGFSNDSPMRKVKVDITWSEE